MDSIIYSTDVKTGKKTLIKKTCNACKKNPLMSDCSCSKELTDVNHPSCIILYQAIQKSFPTV